MKKLILFFCLINCCSIFAQPAIQWQRSFGSTNEDHVLGAVQTNDNGYIVAGISVNSAGDSASIGNHGDLDGLVIKVDSSGNVIWKKFFGGSDREDINGIKQTVDGNYIVYGTTQSTNGDLSQNTLPYAQWLLKINDNGDIIWSKTIQVNFEYSSYGLTTLSTGEFLLIGTIYWNDTTFNNTLSYDMTAVLLDSTCNVIWQNMYGGSSIEQGFKCLEANDGTLMLAGINYSNNNECTSNHGIADIWAVNIDHSGNLLWQKSVGGVDSEESIGIVQDANDNYYIAGFAQSNSFDVSGNHGNKDIWLVKLSPTGTFLKQKCLGGIYTDIASEIAINQAGNLIVSGNTGSSDGDVTFNHGNSDFWVLELDTAFNILWEKCYGGTSYETSYSIIPTNDGGNLVVGGSRSLDGDVTGHTPNVTSNDFWVVKLNSLSSDINVVNPALDALNIYPNPVKETFKISAKMSGKINLSIRNSIGRLMSQSNYENAEKIIFNATEYPAGMYLITVQDDNGSRSIKFLKNE
jgi:hypothetical protein